MSKGRHKNGRSTTPLGIAIGATSLIAGVTMLPPALVELFRYSPYEDPGAGRAGMLLLIGFLGLAGLPLLCVAVRSAWAAGQSYLSWKQRLTPQELALLSLGELGALIGAHALFRDYNRRESARLTDSVMGGKYTYDPVQDRGE